MLAHYTWSKMIDNASHSSGQRLVARWLDQYAEHLGSAWRARAFVSRRRASLSSPAPMSCRSAQARFGSNLNRGSRLVRGRLGSQRRALMQSGMPLQVTQSGGNIWDGTQRPNLIGDPSTSGRVQDRLNNYFNTAAFSQPAPTFRAPLPAT